MKPILRFEIPGKTQAQQRTGRTIMKGRIVSYDPEDSRNYKAYVRLIASQHKPAEPLTGPLNIRIDVFRSIPKKFTKKQRQEAIEGKLRPLSKPDCTNYAKGIEDALNGLLWHDDSSIVTITISKWYGVEPKAIIHLTPLDELAWEAPPIQV